jgi:hypothetical protein
MRELGHTFGRQRNPEHARVGIAQRDDLTRDPSEGIRGVSGRFGSAFAAGRDRRRQHERDRKRTRVARATGPACVGPARQIGDDARGEKTATDRCQRTAHGFAGWRAGTEHGRESAEDDPSDPTFFGIEIGIQRIEQVHQDAGGRQTQRAHERPAAACLQPAVGSDAHVPCRGPSTRRPERGLASRTCASIDADDVVGARQQTRRIIRRRLHGVTGWWGWATGGPPISSCDGTRRGRRRDRSDRVTHGPTLTRHRVETQEIGEGAASVAGSRDGVRGPVGRGSGHPFRSLLEGLWCRT